MRKPNFFIVGAPKCGTTALAHYLSEHPDIFISNPKEPLFFLHPCAENRKITSESHYLSLFKKAKAELAIGEASVWYLYSNHARQKIKEFNPHAKIIIMTRNPVDFVASLHSQQVFGGHEQYLNLEEAWHQRKNLLKGEIEYETIEKIPGWGMMYSELMAHNKYIAKYIKDFGQENVLVLSQEELAKSPRKCYIKTLSFLGVPDNQKISFPVINGNKAHKYNWIRVLLHFSKNQKLAIYIVQLIKKYLGIGTLGIYKCIRDSNIIYTPRKRLPDNLQKEILEREKFFKEP